MGVFLRTKVVLFSVESDKLIGDRTCGFRNYLSCVCCNYTAQTRDLTRAIICLNLKGAFHLREKGLRFVSKNALQTLSPYRLLLLLNDLAFCKQIGTRIVEPKTTS